MTEGLTAVSLGVTGGMAVWVAVAKGVAEGVNVAVDGGTAVNVVVAEAAMVGSLEAVGCAVGVETGVEVGRLVAVGTGVGLAGGVVVGARGVMVAMVGGGGRVETAVCVAATLVWVDKTVAEGCTVGNWLIATGVLPALMMGVTCNPATSVANSSIKRGLTGAK